jgi:hypothetical protein
MGLRTTALLKLRSQWRPDFFEEVILYRSPKIFPGPEWVRVRTDFSEMGGLG